MRYTPLVLGALAVGQAAANSRHASFHARRHAAEKRGDYDNVDWEKVSYDLSGVDWDEVFGKKTSTSSTQAAYTPPAPSKTSSPPTTPTPAAPSKVTSQAESKPSDDSNDNPIGDFLESVLEGVDEFCSKVGIKIPGKNSRTNNGKIWIGDDSPWKANFINDGNDDGLVVCWVKEAGDFTSLAVGEVQPYITMNLPKGKSQVVSFASETPSSCSIMYPGSKISTVFGGIANTWWEANYGGEYGGTFDVSRNPNLNGDKIHSKGSKCTADMETCVYKCNDGATSCTYGYELYNCDASNGGGGGYDPNMGGTGGGCNMNKSSETIQVTFSN